MPRERAKRMDRQAKHTSFRFVLFPLFLLFGLCCLCSRDHLSRLFHPLTSLYSLLLLIAVGEPSFRSETFPSHLPTYDLNHASLFVLQLVRSRTGAVGYTASRPPALARSHEEEWLNRPRCRFPAFSSSPYPAVPFQVLLLNRVLASKRRIQLSKKSENAFTFLSVASLSLLRFTPLSLSVSPAFLDHRTAWRTPSTTPPPTPHPLPSPSSPSLARAPRRLMRMKEGVERVEVSFRHLPNAPHFLLTAFLVRRALHRLPLLDFLLPSFTSEDIPKTSFVKQRRGQYRRGGGRRHSPFAALGGGEGER
jgi:hypothetical protein